MTRLGWSILALFLFVGAAFWAVTDFGSPGGGRRPPAARQVPRVAPAIGLPDVLVVPVVGVPRGALRDSWGDTRGGGTRGHHGTDIMAPGGTPVIAAAPGTIEKLFQSRLGGTTLYVRSPDRRWTYYYAHLAGYADGIREGLRVAAGDRLGYVGDTGDAGPGNYHLHFGMTRMQPGERWHQGQDVDPYPILARSGPQG